MSNTNRPYEAMILISQPVANDLNGVVDHINDLLERCSGELIALKKWDERRLAFEIDGIKRGVYLLMYFRAGPDSLVQFERDCNLSELITRVLVVKADHLTEDEMQAADARTELATEAKLRAERAAAAVAEQQQTVSVGRPDQEQMQPADAPSEPSGDAPAADAPEGETAPTGVDQA